MITTLLRSKQALPVLAALFIFLSAAIVAILLGSGSRTSMAELKDPRIEIRKAERSLKVFDGPVQVRFYRIGLGDQPVGDKETESDGRTPEGDFYVFVKNPESKFHLSLGISYPSPEDAERGLKAGIISRSEHDEILAAFEARSKPPQKTALGGEIYIHGNGAGSDWTRGCIALSDIEMEELFEMIPAGTPVSILP
jgi:murein L,D-transpeptidase YafK